MISGARPHYLFPFTRHICRAPWRRGFQPRHSQTATHICRIARGSVAPQRTMRSGIGGNPTTLQHPTTLIAICDVASKGKRHDETPTVRKTPSLPLRPMLRKLQPPVPDAGGLRLSRPSFRHGGERIPRQIHIICRFSVRYRGGRASEGFREWSCRPSTTAQCGRLPSPRTRSARRRRGIFHSAPRMPPSSRHRRIA